LAFSIEPRYPFFDKRLLEFCLALPGEQKLYNGWSRMIMRRAMAGILPKEVQWRATKSDLSPNFNSGLLTFERKRLEKLILNDPKVIEAYVDIQTLQEVYQRYASKKGSEEAMSVWKVLTLGLWLSGQTWLD